MKKAGRTCAVLFAAALLSGTAPVARAQVLSTAVGTVAGTAAGGYVTLSIIVARAQTGHYLHEFSDVLGWTSTPVLIGAITGASVGFWWPDRLWSGFAFGAGGTAIGIPIGMVVGMALSDRPEAKWAGGAIGAGAGMAFGAIYGVLRPEPSLVPKAFRNSVNVPIAFSFRF
ncbi:MAG TPA: hypothetical protein VK864_03245 [Longimicrobiales bacterium]|nr:hypothetical protein [Longimicrobiales bacterium]